MMVRYKVTTVKGFSAGKNIYPKLQPEYVLQYKNGETVEKIKGTLGIFCFKTFEEALNFANEWVNDSLSEGGSLVIKEVIPFSKAIRKPRNIACRISSIDLFYDSEHKMNKSDAIPEGTIIYDKVNVIRNIITILPKKRYNYERI